LWRAVEALDGARALEMRTACEQRAQLFGRDRFVAGIHEILAKCVAAGDKRPV
jgi:hypothetical protein